jgi:hypothetical protein
VGIVTTFVALTDSPGASVAVSVSGKTAALTVGTPGANSISTVTNAIATKMIFFAISPPFNYLNAYNEAKIKTIYYLPYILTGFIAAPSILNPYRSKVN